eukprot:SAG25_NODE_329_length_9697_cov_22.376120_3_plen_554_part_00
MHAGRAVQHHPPLPLRSLDVCRTAPCGRPSHHLTPLTAAQPLMTKGTKDFGGGQAEVAKKGGAVGGDDIPSATGLKQGAIICAAVALGYALAIATAGIYSPSAGNCEPPRILFHGPTLGRPPTTVEAQWLADEGAKRAVEYIRVAERLFAGSMREQEQEIARSGELNDGGTSQRRHQALILVQQVLGALDLAPSPSNQLDASKLLVSACDIDPQYASGEGQYPMIDYAIALAAAACHKQDNGNAEAKDRLHALVNWIDEPTHHGVQLAAHHLAPHRKEIRRAFGKRVRGWLRRSNPPELPASFLISNNSKAKRSSSDSMREAIATSLRDHALFPTHVMTTNVIDMMPAEFCERLAKLVRKKYRTFEKEQQAQFIAHSPADINLTTSLLNDQFFMHQTKSFGQLDDSEGGAWWPEMYRRSKDFKLLRKVIHAAMREYATRHGFVTPAEPWQSGPDLYDINLWSTVYPDDSVHPGARIGYHNHPGSFVSCVIYLQTPEQPSPIAFVDPRGVDSTRDWHAVKQKTEESDLDTQREPSFLLYGCVRSYPSPDRRVYV